MNALIASISKHEDDALECGDLLTAIKLNWLRNSCKFDGIDYDTACVAYMNITLVGKYVDNHRGRYGDVRASVY